MRERIAILGSYYMIVIIINYRHDRIFNGVWAFAETLYTKFQRVWELRTFPVFERVRLPCGQM